MILTSEQLAEHSFDGQNTQQKHITKSINLVVKKKNNMNTIASTTWRLIEPGYKTLTLRSFVSDAIRLWNQAPIPVKNS